jgi:hypothetical protein
MRKTHIDGNEFDQLTNVQCRDNHTSSVSLSNQQASPRESEQSSSGELSVVLQAAIETGLIIVGLLFVALLLPRPILGDGQTRYRDLLRLLSTHTLFQPSAWYSLIGPLFSTPLLLIGKQLGHPQAWTSFYHLTLFSLCLLLSYFLLRNHVDRGLLRKFFLMLIYGSMFVAPLDGYYGEVFTALSVGFGVFVAFRRFTSIGGWVAVILGVANTPATLIGLGLLVLKRMLDSKCWRYILVFGATVLCIIMETWLRHHKLFNTQYVTAPGVRTVMPYSGRPGFSYPFLFGLLSILFSFGKGLLFYTPGLLLPIRKTLSKWPQHQKINLFQVYTLWMCFVVGLIIIYSPWWGWNGGLGVWGPRFFLFASIPASFALAVRLIRYKEASLGINLLTLVVFCLSAWVSVDGAVFQQLIVPYICAQNRFTTLFLCWYTPDYSPLWQPFVLHLHIYLNQGEKVFLWFSLLVAAYLAAPLFIHLLKQIRDFVKKHTSEYMNVKLWRI